MSVENLEWKHLPEAGSLLEQNEALMHDLGTINYVSQMVEQMLKDDKDDKEKPGGK